MASRIGVSKVPTPKHGQIIKNPGFNRKSYVVKVKASDTNKPATTHKNGGNRKHQKKSHGTKRRNTKRRNTTRHGTKRRNTTRRGTRKLRR